MATHTYLALDALRIGIVDDNAYFRRLVRTMLSGFGVRQVLEATTVDAAWEIVLRQTPDVLLVDWNLGGEDGIRLLDRIRTHPSDRLATQAVVFLSAHTDKRHVLTAARLGANDFIVKPVSARVLYERLRRLTSTRLAYRRQGDRLVPAMGGPTAARPVAGPGKRVIPEPDAAVTFI